MEIATKARQSAGVVFAADKNIKEGEEEIMGFPNNFLWGGFNQCCSN